MSLPSPPLGNHKSAPVSMTTSTATTIVNNTLDNQNRRLHPFTYSPPQQHHHQQEPFQRSPPAQYQPQPQQSQSPHHTQLSSPQKLAPWPQPDYRVSQQQEVENQRAAAARKKVFQDMDQVGRKRNLHFIFTKSNIFFCSHLTNSLLSNYIYF